MNSNPPNGGNGNIPPRNAPPLRPGVPRPMSSASPPPQARPPQTSPSPQSPPPRHSAPGAAGAIPPGNRPPPSQPNPRSPRRALEPERVPMPARRSRRARHPLVVVGNAIFTLLVLLTVGLGFATVVGKQRFDAAGPLEQDKVVIIPRGYGVRDISDLLTREGVIDQPWVFIGGAVMLKSRGGLKSGEYQFAQHASLADVVETIIEGRVVQHHFTVAEGLTSEQIVARLLETEALAGQIKEIPREGTLLPETYKFTRGMTRDQIIQSMQRADRRVLQDVWEHRSPDLPVKTPEQLVTLASIVEKETGKPDERSRVAAVFVNRLKNKMRLQSDPTIIYGLTGGKGSLGRPIMKSEIEQHTPYNTYVIDGLPPGPIANPGRASLEASANPARTKELYFVADGTGGHVFSENYEQHQKNVARLRVSEHENAAAAAAATPAPAAPAPAGAKKRQPAL
ncbi:MAG TPA: endolytic transglycosylase MltG [Pseudolabrys sp.]|nr:endolytic transglycosylase MltG [Pseudolabrys sp.]